LRRLAALFLSLAALATIGVGRTSAAGHADVLIGLDGEFGHVHSRSAEAIRLGMRIAIDEVNAAGGVLGGRRLALVERSNASLPARSTMNIREFAAMPDLVAVFCGRFSPTVLDNMALIHELRIPLLDPWAAADRIVDNGHSPNYVFRLSMRDSWASATMLGYLKRRGLKRVGMLSLGTAWGRSTRRAVEGYVAEHGGIVLVGNRWIGWDDNEASLKEKLDGLRAAGAQAVLLTANAGEAAHLANVLLALPKAQRLPVVSHWGVAGGDLPGVVGPRFAELDFKVVQTYSFIGQSSPVARRVVAAYNALTGTRGPRGIVAPAGVAHAYDLTHILARAIEQAGSTDRVKVRDALERLGAYDGLVRRYAPPFSAVRHEALTPADVFLAGYAPGDHALEPVR
jgi:branched-chain amino acid transport system substrate-binding protein